MERKIAKEKNRPNYEKLLEEKWIDDNVILSSVVKVVTTPSATLTSTFIKFAK